MKKIADIRDDIKGLDRILAKADEHKPSAITRAANRRLLLLNCITYLETEPTEAFVEKQIAELEKKVIYAVSEDNFKTWVKATPGAIRLTNPRKAFESEFDLSKSRKQLRTLRYILD